MGFLCGGVMCVDVADGDQAEELAVVVADGEVSDAAVADDASGLIDFGFGMAEDDFVGHDLGDGDGAWG